MSESTTFQLDFITPEEVVASKRAEMVVVPAVEGDIGVLPGHSQVIARLRPGMVCVFSNNEIQERFFVEGGIAEINAEYCVLLIEKAIAEKSLDADLAAQELDDLREKTTNNQNDEHLIKKIMIAEAKIEAINYPPYS